VARLVLKHEGEVVREFPLTEEEVTIGRLPDNDLQVDHPAVSGHHMKIVYELGRFVLYDQNSTNGSYLNGHKVSRAVLSKGDTVLIGTHTLVYEENGTAVITVAAPKPRVATTEAPFQPAERVDESLHPVSVPVFAASEKTVVGRLTVVEGKTDQSEYVLTTDEIVIGKSETAHVRLLRWFAPKVAAIIRRRGGHYYVQASGNTTPVHVNSEPVHRERELADGDTILVDEITLQFHLQR
jgi:pSer/pThr/pTyr-binding forkhead associated (FHA) protein